MLKLPLHWQIVIALIAGALAGWLIGAPMLQFAFIGTLFMNALKMIIIPLIAASIITGMTGVGQSGNIGRLGTKTFIYYISTSLFAILTGLILVNILQPGIGAELGLQEQPDKLAASMAQFGDTPGQAIKRLLIGIIPTNLVNAMASGQILQLIFFCLLFGFFITRLKSPLRTTLSNFFDAFFAVMMNLTQFIIRFAPIGIFALVSKTVATTGFAAFKGLSIYVLTVIIALAIHAFINLPIMLYLFGRVNPRHHAQAMSPALLTAFSTSSSSATLPLTLESLEKRAKVSNRITSFTIPLGATINMDGTALYECVAAMFIAQAYGIELTFADQFLVVLTALLASIGAAGIPMAGLVMISVILSAVGLPLEGIGLILAVDRILDMCRTTVNVWSDSCGAALIAKSEGE